MSRDPSDLLAERTARLEADLAALESKRREAATASVRAAEIAQELAEAKRTLTSLEKKRPARGYALPLLDRIAIASPCSARWADMRGDDKVRFCGACEKNVYDLSAMTREEAEQTLQTLGTPCVRFHRRADGTVMTQDCPVGVRRKRMRLAAVLAIGSGLTTAVAGLFVFLGAETPEPPPPPSVLVIPSATAEPPKEPVIPLTPAGGPAYRDPVPLGRIQVRPPHETGKKLPPKKVPHVR